MLASFCAEMTDTEWWTRAHDSRERATQGHARGSKAGTEQGQVINILRRCNDSSRNAEIHRTLTTPAPPPPLRRTLYSRRTCENTCRWCHESTLQAEAKKTYIIGANVELQDGSVLCSNQTVAEKRPQLHPTDNCCVDGGTGRGEGRPTYERAGD